MYVVELAPSGEPHTFLDGSARHNVQHHARQGPELYIPPRHRVRPLYRQKERKSRIVLPLFPCNLPALQFLIARQAAAWAAAQGGTEDARVGSH